MKVYIVEISKGQYSDHSTYVSGVFDDRDVADKYADDITKYYESAKELEAPYSNDDYLESKLTNKQDEEYSSWQTLHYDANDFNNAYVTEHEINTKEPIFTKPI